MNDAGYIANVRAIREKSKFIYFFASFKPYISIRIAGHSPVPSRGERNTADLGAVRQAAAFELLAEEALAENL